MKKLTLPRLASAVLGALFFLAACIVLAVRLVRGEHDTGSKEKQCAQNGRGQTRQGELLHGATSENVY